jgi:hypothetical protein
VGKAVKETKPQRSLIMPVHKVKGGYQWGSKGKVYPTKAQAEKQGRAAYANGYTGKKK